MLRHTQDVTPATYLGGICLCVPSFTASTDEEGTRHPGLLDHMAGRYGAGAFDVGGEETRFASLLNSGCTLGNSLRQLFDQLQDEVYGPIDRANLPSTSVFRHGPQVAGVVDGEIEERPQHEFTEERENARESKVRTHLKFKRMHNPQRLPIDGYVLRPYPEG